MITVSDKIKRRMKQKAPVGQWRGFFIRHSITKLDRDRGDHPSIPRAAPVWGCV